MAGRHQYNKRPRKKCLFVLYHTQVSLTSAYMELTSTKPLREKLVELNITNLT